MGQPVASTRNKIELSINLIDVFGLVVVKVKSIFEFLETVFNTPTKQILGNNHFGRGVEFVGNTDVVAIVVILIFVCYGLIKVNM